MKDCSIIEFYVRTTLIAAVLTEAPPPEKDSIINIKSRDYRVVRTDYSIDQLDKLKKTYRRNTFLWPTDTPAGEDPFSANPR